MSATQLGEDFNRALGWAEALHRTQVRKGSGVPYVSHLLSVAALVLEDGGSETEAVAALLHDAMEDQGVTFDDVARRHGTEVARIVQACTDGTGDPKPPWLERKLAHIDKLRAADEAVLRVSIADKLHNVRSQVADHDVVGDELWTRFTAGRDAQLWYHRRMLAVFEQRLPGRLARHYREAVEDLHERAGVDLARSDAADEEGWLPPVPQRPSG